MNAIIATAAASRMISSVCGTKIINAVISFVCSVTVFYHIIYSLSIIKSKIVEEVFDLFVFKSTRHEQKPHIF